MTAAALRKDADCARAQARALAQERWLPLERAAEAAVCGGKAVNLSRLVNAGFSVPEAVVITVPALHEFLHATGLDGEIARLEKQAGESFDDLQALEQSVRALFAQRALPSATRELLGLALVAPLPWPTALLVAVFGPAVHFAFSAALFAIGVKARMA